MSIAFIDLRAQRARVQDQIDAAIRAVVESGQYILGPQVGELEKQLSAFSGAAKTLSCANGTDALLLPLRAWGVGPGDAVFCPTFTFVASAEVMPLLGATPVFVDILPDTYNIDPDHLEKTIEMVRKDGKLKPKAIIAVDLFGQPADYPRIAAIARKHNLKLVADSAQGFGCALAGKHPITWADVVTTSFFPSKPLGCYGDGGAVQTNDLALGETIDSLRVHGQATKLDVERRKFEQDPKYLNMRVGMNSRLDTIQAAVLLVKLAIFQEEVGLRQEIARRYGEGLQGLVKRTPHVIENGVSVWAQYTIEVGDRARLAAHLKAEGIPTAIYYPVPLHKQPAYSAFPVGPGGAPVAEAKADHVISLPMHPYLGEQVQDRIISAIRSFIKA